MIGVRAIHGCPAAPPAGSGESSDTTATAKEGGAATRALPLCGDGVVFLHAAPRLEANRVWMGQRCGVKARLPGCVFVRAARRGLRADTGHGYH